MCKQKAPDTSGVQAAAKQSADTSQQALDWYKQEATRTQGQRDQSTQVQNDIAAQQLAADKQQTSAAADTQNFLNTSVRPTEQAVIDNARNYDTPGREQAASDAAVADVTAAQGRAQTGSAQALARMGYDPTTNANSLAASQALQQAGAATQARRQTQLTGNAMLTDAANMGQGIASNQVAQLNSGANAGQVGAGAATAAGNSQMQQAALMGQGFGTALQGTQLAGNLYGQQAQLQAGPGNGALFGMLGNLGGAAISQWSSKKLKTAGPAMPDHVALDAITKGADGTSSFADSSAGEGGHFNPGPNYSSPGKHTAALASMSNDAWKYKPGVSDGAVHVGPYAEEARAKLGAKVAPGGKKLDMLESAKYNGEAIRELTARVDKLHKALGASA